VKESKGVNETSTGLCGVVCFCLVLLPFYSCCSGLEPDTRNLIFDIFDIF